jgi:hypothetical protein
MTPADLASRLCWLPCEACGQAGIIHASTPENGWCSWCLPGRDLSRCACHPCNGVGFLPSPAVLEAMAEVLHAVGGPRPKLREAYPGPVIKGDDRWGIFLVMARAAWEAQARLVLKGEK